MMVLAGDLSAASVPELVAEVEAARAYRLRARAQHPARLRQRLAPVPGLVLGQGLEPLPAFPEVVATYLASLARAGRADSTVTRHLAAITWQHRHDGLPPRVPATPTS
ncbi:hypothetical protein ACFSLT_31395 [Novosphingobium resinovorum]